MDGRQWVEGQAETMVDAATGGKVQCRRAGMHVSRRAGVQACRQGIQGLQWMWHGQQLQSSLSDHAELKFVAGDRSNL